MNASSFSAIQAAAASSATFCSALPQALSGASTYSIAANPAPEVDLKALQDAVATTLAMRPMPTKRAPTLRLAVEALKRGEQPFLPSAR